MQPGNQDNAVPEQEERIRGLNLNEAAPEPRARRLNLNLGGPGFFNRIPIDMLQQILAAIPPGRPPAQRLASSELSNLDAPPATKIVKQ